MVLATGFLLLVSLTISTVLEVLSELAGGLIPGFTPLWQIANIVVSFGVFTLLFALIFKVVPDVEIAWSDLWPGAALTSLLFNLGKHLIGLYLGHANIGSTYGAAGSLVILLIWIYYSAQIFFFGAEFVQVYTMKYGSWARPKKGAPPPTEATRARERAASRDGLTRLHRAAAWHEWLAMAVFGFMLGLVIGWARGAEEQRDG